MSRMSPTYMPRGRSGRGQASDLFRAAAARDSRVVPLAERMRPRTLDEVVGQRHILGPNTLLREAIETDQVPSLILWGPPGTGKTTLARVIAAITQADLVAISAVESGIKDIRETVQRAVLRCTEQHVDAVLSAEPRDGRRCGPEHVGTLCRRPRAVGRHHAEGALGCVEGT